MARAAVWVLVVLCAAGTTARQGVAAAPVQTQTDEYMRYELLSPESSSFAIRSKVAATTAGVKYFRNRPGPVTVRNNTVPKPLFCPQKGTKTWGHRGNRWAVWPKF